MSTKREFGKYAFNGSAALLFALSMMPLTVAADTDPFFQGVATLCAVSPNVVDPDAYDEQKGNNGVLLKYNMSFIYLIRAEEGSLMNGWENQSNNEKRTGGMSFYWGSAEFVPDRFSGTGALVEDFKYSAKKIANGISGTFTGTGVLEGVTVDYELSPPIELSAIDFPTDCWGYIALCGGCYPALLPGDDEEPGTEDDLFIQYGISGWIEGYEP